MKKLTTLIIALVALNSTAHSLSKAIFGADNRRDIYQSSSRIKKFSSALATWVPPYFVEETNGKLDLIFPSLKEEYQMCSDEKFVSQPTTMISCTAFLVADDLMLTAGHCMVNVGIAENTQTAMCKDFNWVFDYQINKRGEEILKQKPLSTKVKCVNVIKAIHTELGDNRVDFALFRIDQKMPKRFQFQPSTREVRAGRAVDILGYPSGLPLKYSSAATVLKDHPSKNYFEANIDSVGGNSGSPVFGKSGELFGILVRGNDDFITDKRLNCDRWNKCSNNGKRCDDGIQDEDYDSGMHVQKITSEIKSLINNNR
jgi:V8-like Glu-specific endopeptidase